MCGVIGIYSKSEVNKKLFFGLNSLQHRGQESCGITVSNGENLHREKGMGLVIDVFKEENLNNLVGNIGIGHVRYSTAGGSHDYNTQPLMAFAKGIEMSLAHNGNLIMKLIKGAYAVVLCLKDKLVAFRDPLGIRPLVMGKNDEDVVFASENAAVEIVGATEIRDVKPGEIIVVDKEGANSSMYSDGNEPRHCFFEYVYFAREDATLDGTNAYNFRRRCGEYLSQESPCDVDLVVPVPDSGIPSAIGFAQKTGIPYAQGLVKNRYMGRTFIKPTQAEREMAVKLKLNPLRHVLKGKRIVLIDDSIVRGTTSANLIQRIREAGATEVHMRITSPPVKFPCYYGIDTPSRKHLIAANMDIEAIREKIGADSLAFISMEGMIKSSKDKTDNFCKACFDGDYPVDPIVI